MEIYQTRERVFNMQTGEEIENSTWARVDMEFLAEGSTR